MFSNSLIHAPLLAIRESAVADQLKQSRKLVKEEVTEVARQRAASLFCAANLLPEKLTAKNVKHFHQEINQLISLINQDLLLIEQHPHLTSYLLKTPWFNLAISYQEADAEEAAGNLIINIANLLEHAENTLPLKITGPRINEQSLTSFVRRLLNSLGKHLKRLMIPPQALLDLAMVEKNLSWQARLRALFSPNLPTSDFARLFSLLSLSLLAVSLVTVGAVVLISADMQNPSTLERETLVRRDLGFLGFCGFLDMFFGHFTQASYEEGQPHRQFMFNQAKKIIASMQKDFYSITPHLTPQEIMHKAGLYPLNLPIFQEIIRKMVETQQDLTIVIPHDNNYQEIFYCGTHVVDSYSCYANASAFVAIARSKNYDANNSKGYDLVPVRWLRIFLRDRRELFTAPSAHEVSQRILLDDFVVSGMMIWGKELYNKIKQLNP